MNTRKLIRTGEWALILLLSFTVLWKGGKSIDATWVLAGVSGALTLMTASQKPDDTQDNRKRFLPIILWVLIHSIVILTVLSYFFSNVKNYGLDEVIRTVSLGLLFLWIVRVRFEIGHTWLEERLPEILSFLTAIACFIGIAVYILQPVDRFVGTFFDWRFHTDYWPNAWADYLLLAWPIVLLSAWKKRSKHARLLALALLSLTIATLYLSYSRGALLAFLGQVTIMVTLFCIIALKDMRYKRIFPQIVRSACVKSGIVIVCSFILFFAINDIRSSLHAVQDIKEKVTFTADEGRSSVDERVQFWMQAIELTKEHPLIGWGPYSFRFIQPQYMHDVLATADHPHNVLLKFAVERGIPMSMLFFCLVSTILLSALRSFFWKRKAMSFEKDAFTIVSVGAVGGMLLHQMIDYNLQFVGVSVTATILLALLIHPLVTYKPREKVKFSEWKLRLNMHRLDIFLASLLLIVCLYEGMFLITSSYGRKALAENKIEEALLHFEASHTQFYSRDLFLSEATLHIAKRDYEAAHRSLDAYADLNKEDPRLWKLRGQVYLQEGSYAKARSTLEQAYKKGKYTDVSITRLYIDALRMENNQQILTQRKEAFTDVFLAFANAIEHNTHFIALSQNVEELDLLRNRLSDLYPENWDTYEETANSAITHAAIERGRLAARRPGVLW